MEYYPENNLCWEPKSNSLILKKKFCPETDLKSSNEPLLPVPPKDPKDRPFGFPVLTPDQHGLFNVTELSGASLQLKQMLPEAVTI